MMTSPLRQSIHEATDQLPEEHLASVLRVIQLFIAAGHTDIEPEELFLLESGKLKALVDAIQDAPPPVEDWQKYLNDL